MTDAKIEETIGKSVLSGLGAAIAMPFAWLFLLPFTVLNAWALTILYGWFILPVFTTLPALGVAPMMGVMAFKGTLLHRALPYKSADDKKSKPDYMFDVLYGPIALIFAYPVHWWMT